MSAPTPRRLQRKQETAKAGRKAERGHRLPTALELALQARAGRRCELCGELLRDRCHRHHRLLLSQGGKDEISNVVLLHPMCHHQTIHLNPEWAKENGWIVLAGKNPSTVPILLHNHRKVRLTRDGNYLELAA